MKRYGFVPKQIVTDKRPSCGTAKTEVAPGLDHCSHKGLNKRAESSHLPFSKTGTNHARPPIAGALQRFGSMH
ncbi:hypothetical protein [Mesorhizobium sp. M0496]|uniref:hypothetical protein n=1 Tax=Mesorhizobium sp. M0496 TaxID=2956952 RepID=UPI003339DAE3